MMHSALKKTTHFIGAYTVSCFAGIIGMYSGYKINDYIYDLNKK